MAVRTARGDRHASWASFDLSHVAERARANLAAVHVAPDAKLIVEGLSGFRLTRIVPTPARVAVIEGELAG